MTRPTILVFEVEPLPRSSKATADPKEFRQWRWEIYDGDVLIAAKTKDWYDGEVGAHRDARTNAEQLGFFDQAAA